MSVTPTAGIAAAWSAAKPNPNARAAQTAAQGQKKPTDETPPEASKGPPAPEGQGTRVDKRA